MAKQKEKPPVALDLRAGDLPYQSVAGGYEDREVRLELTENRSYPVSFFAATESGFPTQTGHLKVESTPPGADLHVTGNPEVLP